MAAAKTKITPAMTGEHAKLVVFQDSNKRMMDFKTWTMKPNVTKHNDSINGAEVDELDKTLNYYELTGEMYNRDIDILDAWIEQQEPYDSATTPLDQEAATRFYPRNGTRESYVLVGLIWDDFDANQGGRATKLMTTVNLRFQKIAKAKTL